MKQKLFQQEIKIQLLLNIFFYPNNDLLDLSLMMNYSDSYLRTQISQINSYLVHFETEVLYEKTNKTYFLESENSLVLLSLISELICASGYESDMLKLGKNYNETFNEYIASFDNKIKKNDLEILFKPVKIEDFLIKRSNNQLKAKEVYEETLAFESLFSLYLRQYYVINQFQIDEDEFRELVNIFIIVTTKLKMNPIRVDNFLNRYDYFLETFFKENPIKTKEFLNAIDYFSKNTGIDYENYKSEILFNIFTKIQSLRKFREFKIGIYSDLGEMHATSLIIALEKHFATHHFSIFSEVEHYDFIVSTIEKKLDAKNIITISDYLSRQDIFNIHQVIYMPS